MRYVVHYGSPKSPEGYYQEMGRAGRDGMNSTCVMFWAPKDFQTQKFLINKCQNKSMIPKYMSLLTSMQAQLYNNAHISCQTKIIDSDSLYLCSTHLVMLERNM